MTASPYELRSSASGRWVHCPGSVRLCKTVPDEEGPAAVEGTAGHWVMAEYLAGRFPPVGTVTPNGSEVTAEMLSGAALFAAAMFPKIDAQTLMVEQTMPCLDVHPACGGTVDSGGLSKTISTTTIHVGDYKFGHEYIDVYENWQALCYVFALFEYFVSVGALHPIDEQTAEVEITIVQPRNYDAAGPVRTWRVPLISLRPHRNKLRYAAEQAMGDNPRLVVGDHCDNCPARIVCPALQGVGYKIADYAGRAIPNPLSALQLGAELRWIQAAKLLLDARAESLAAEALSRNKRGEPVAYFGIEHPAGRLVWKPGKEADVIALADLLKKNLRAETKAITPTQAKALGLPQSVIDEFAFRPKGEAKLVAIDTSTTSRIFGDIAS